MDNVPKLRTVAETVREIRGMEENCYVTEHMLRRAIREKKIRCIESGNRKILDLDDVIEYLRGRPQ